MRVAISPKRLKYNGSEHGEKDHTIQAVQVSRTFEGLLCGAQRIGCCIGRFFREGTLPITATASIAFHGLVLRNEQRFGLRFTGKWVEMVATNELAILKTKVGAILILAVPSSTITMSMNHGISRIRLRIVGALHGDEFWTQRTFKVNASVILAASTLIF